MQRNWGVKCRLRVSTARCLSGLAAGSGVRHVFKSRFRTAVYPVAVKKRTPVFFRRPEETRSILYYSVNL